MVAMLLMPLLNRVDQHLPVVLVDLDRRVAEVAAPRFASLDELESWREFPHLGPLPFGQQQFDADRARPRELAPCDLHPVEGSQSPVTGHQADQPASSRVGLWNAPRQVYSTARSPLPVRAAFTVAEAGKAICFCSATHHSPAISAKAHTQHRPPPACFMPHAASGRPPAADPAA